MFFRAPRNTVSGPGFWGVKGLSNKSVEALSVPEPLAELTAAPAGEIAGHSSNSKQLSASPGFEKRQPVKLVSWTFGLFPLRKNLRAAYGARRLWMMSLARTKSGGYPLT